MNNYLVETLISDDPFWMLDSIFVHYVHNLGYVQIFCKIGLQKFVDTVNRKLSRGVWEHGLDVRMKSNMKTMFEIKSN